jgi:hypothetical protein
VSDLDVAVSMAAGSVIRAAEPPALQPVAVGVIEALFPSGDGFLVQISGVFPSLLTVSSESLSSVFIAEARASGAALAGRRVVILFASNQALVAYTIGV